MTENKDQLGNHSVHKALFDLDIHRFTGSQVDLMHHQTLLSIKLFRVLPNCATSL